MGRTEIDRFASSTPNNCTEPCRHVSPRQRMQKHHRRAYGSTHCGVAAPTGIIQTQLAPGTIFVPEAGVQWQLIRVLQLTLVVDPNTALVRDLLADPAPTIAGIRIPLRAKERRRSCSFSPWLDHRVSAWHYRLALVNCHQTLRGTDWVRLCLRCGVVVVGYDQGSGNDTSSNDDRTPRRGLPWARLGG